MSRIRAIGPSPMDTAGNAHISSTGKSLRRSSSAAGELQAEREKLATLLHDHILQEFGTCLLKAQVCERLLQMGQPARAGQELAVLQERLNEAVEQIRDVIAGLKQSDPDLI